MPVKEEINQIRLDEAVIEIGSGLSLNKNRDTLQPKKKYTLSSDSAANVRFGTTVPVPTLGDKEGDHYFRTKPGNNTGDPYQEYIFDNGVWYRTDEEDGFPVWLTQGAPLGVAPEGSTSYWDFNGSWTPNMTLPTAVGRRNEIFTVRHEATFNTTINALNKFPATPTVITTATPSVQFISDGNNWIEIPKAIKAPENIIEFSVNANPNTASTVFAPVQPQDPDVIYFSTINNSTWKWNGTAYVTYTAPPSTEWNLSTTTTDAGANKTAAISRLGSVLVGNASLAPKTKLQVVNSGVPVLVPGFGGGQIITDINSSRLYFEQLGATTGERASGITQEGGYLRFGSFSDNGGANVSPNSMVIRNTNGYVGVGNVTPTSNLHVNGSFATNLFFFASGGTTVVASNHSGIEIGSAGITTHTVTLPSATTFNGRRIVVKLSVGGNAIVTVNTLGGNIENEQGLGGTSATLQNGFKAGEWQSDGFNWQLISSNTGGVHRISAAGLLAGNIIPNGYNVYQDFNGTWTAIVTLPTNGFKVGQMLTFEHLAGFNTTIAIANSSMTVPLLVTAAMGGAAWIWNGTKWNLIG